MSKPKQLNEFTLAGLIVGPILGSGLVILPPLLYNEIGNYSLIIWSVLLGLGFLFALVFGKLSTLYPGEGGVSLATEAALGKSFRKLTSFYLICAVLFCPVVMALIAGDYLHALIPGLSVFVSAVCMLLLTYGLLLLKVEFLGKLMLVISSVIALIFVSSSMATLAGTVKTSLSFPEIAVPELGHSILIAFWAIVGWEVIGGYSKEVKSTACFMRGVVIGAIVVSMIYILVVAAICFGTFGGDGQYFCAEQLIGMLFGRYSSGILSSVSILLCLGTLILFIGSISRLISSLKLTQYSSRHTHAGTPLGALNILTAINLGVLALVYFEVFTLKTLVAIADGFFLANAIIGLVSAIILFKKGALRCMAILLVPLFFCILCFSNPLVLIAIASLFVYTYISSRKQNKQQMGEE